MLLSLVGGDSVVPYTQTDGERCAYIPLDLEESHYGNGLPCYLYVSMVDLAELAEGTMSETWTCFYGELEYVQSNHIADLRREAAIMLLIACYA